MPVSQLLLWHSVVSYFAMCSILRPEVGSDLPPGNQRQTRSRLHACVIMCREAEKKEALPQPHALEMLSAYAQKQNQAPESSLCIKVWRSPQLSPTQRFALFRPAYL